VSALVEINEADPSTKAFVMTPVTLKKMMLALNECTEWGRITLLTSLSEYRAVDQKEAEHICERVAPQFQHANPAVVLAAVKAVFLHMKYCGPELRQQYLKKMAPPLGEF
jgi:vesicle coat complex subunit